MEPIYYRYMRDSDKESILRIYGQSIEYEDATYITVTPKWEEWDQIYERKPRIVACINNRVIAFTAIHRGLQSTVELSVYVQKEYRRKGIGLGLIKHLIQATNKMGIPLLQAVIFTNNEASIELHKKAGFHLLGERKQLFYKNGIWRDVYVFQR